MCHLLRGILLCLLLVCPALGMGRRERRLRNRSRKYGGDRGQHGCIGSAGYTWCAAVSECVRLWELEDGHPCNSEKHQLSDQIEDPAASSQCSTAHCRMLCPNGWAKDENGCDKFCECAVAPTSIGAEKKRIYVHPYLIDCEGVVPMKCMQVKSELDSPWELFYDQIKGYRHEEGVSAVLVVNVSSVENPPADGSSLSYKLVHTESQERCKVFRCKSCPGGYKTELNGCPTCDCCSEVMCMLFCPPDGKFAKGIDSCNTCSCP